MSAAFDVAVVGAGLTGACAAALLVQQDEVPAERVALFSTDVPERVTEETPADLRVLALSRASERILKHADAWSRLAARRVFPYERMCVWHASSGPRSTGALRFDAAELAEPNLGYIAENRALQRACLESFIAAGGVMRQEAVTGLIRHADRVEINSVGGPSSARLVVGADGARSSVRAAAGLAVHAHAYQQRAIVASIDTERPHESTAWQRFLPGGPLALLPLHDGGCSIVWSVAEQQAKLLLACGAEEFAALLDRASDQVLGATRLRGERVSVPLHSQYVEDYVAPRYALIGDAAHVVHPLAGQGANLGLLDAAALCEVIVDALDEQEDPGALRALRRYEQLRHTHNRVMGAAMSAFNVGFGRVPSPLTALVNSALGAVNRNSFVRRWFAVQALGVSGELPRFARAAAA